MPRDVFEKLPKPTSSSTSAAASKSTSKSSGKGKGKSKDGKGKGGSKSRSRSPHAGNAIKVKCCWKFLKTGKCDWEEKHGSKCTLPHLTQEEHDKKLKELKEKAAAQPKGKAKAKAKSKGRGRGRGGKGTPAIAEEDYEDGEDYTAEEWAAWETGEDDGPEWLEQEYVDE